MKRKIALLFLFLLMILTAAEAVCAQDDTAIKVPEKYKGAWACERASIDMIRKGGGYTAVIRWGNSYDQTTVWQYTLRYDVRSNSLIDEGTGIKGTITYSEGGVETARTDEYTDGSAAFYINDDGYLIWEDGKEDRASGMLFEKMDYSGFMPTKEQLADRYFKVIGGYHQGTAGSSLAAARAAYEAYDFAQSCRLWAADTDTLRSTLLEAWESMSDQERKAFDENFTSILNLISSSTENWDANKGIFGDAGVPADRMGVLLQDIEAGVSWTVLTAHTLTMGNSDAEEPIPGHSYYCQC